MKSINNFNFYQYLAQLYLKGRMQCLISRGRLRPVELTNLQSEIELRLFSLEKTVIGFVLVARSVIQMLNE